MQKQQIISHVLVGVASAGVGAGVAHILTKKHFQQVANEEIASVKAAYSKVETVVEPAAEHLKKLEEERAEVEKEIKDYTEDIKDLGYQQVSSEDMVDNTPEGAEPLKVGSRVGRYTVTNDVIPAEIDAPNPGRAYVIREDQYHEDFDGYEKHSLVFYEEDDTLAMPDDRPVEDVDAMVGDGLTRFGDGSNDKDIVYVRNQVQRTDFEIVRNKNSYGVLVLGFDKADVEPKVRKMRDHE
jgi:hypothetical protein